MDWQEFHRKRWWLFVIFMVILAAMIVVPSLMFVDGDNGF